MKKKIIVASAASLAMAAMPMAGVFAENYGEAVVDQIQVTVSKICNIRSGGTASSPTYSGAQLSTTVTPGTLIGGDSGQSWASGTKTTLRYNCNDAGGWKITAQGVSGTSGAVAGQTTMEPTGGTSTPIVTGTATSGDTSNWAFKVTGTGASSMYTSFAAIPGTATTVASSSSSVVEGSLTPDYQVWISPAQESDTYTGYVRYILSAPL
ncbi:hypothetical protein IIY66_00580 [Candidatus Saccharibacteria bacterium]|nr:hypothetical protein [Candidatus Saccharibacteria bacterium]